MKVVLFILGLLTGAAAGVFLLAPYVIGAATGIGVGTGLVSGICITAEAAKAKGYISENQLDELIIAAGQQIGDELPQHSEGEAENIDCAEVVARLKAARES